MKKPWSKYTVGEPSTQKNWTNQNCEPFSEIYHVTHLNTAIRIIEDQKVEAGLVYDESILNTERILVNWLSPNTWTNGSIYGNVSFCFDFDELINGKKCYWIEAIKQYSPTALRILVTKKNYDDNPLFQRYDPCAKDGPWWFDKKENTHYRNGLYTLEIMYEGNLRLDESQIKFVDHSDRWCCLNRSNPEKCPDFNKKCHKASAEFIAKVIAAEIECKEYLPVEENNLNSGIKSGGNHLERCLASNAEFKGSITSRSDTVKPLVRATLNAFKNGNEDERMKLISLFKSEEGLMRSLWAIINGHFK